MPSIAAPTTEVGAVNITQPLGGVNAKAASGVLYPLITWDAVQGDVLYGTVLGTAAGGGTRLHRFGAGIVAPSLTVSTGNLTVSVGAIVAKGATFNGQVVVSGGSGSAVAGSFTVQTGIGFTIVGATGSGYDFAVLRPSDLAQAFGIPHGTLAFQAFGRISTNHATAEDNNGAFTNTSATGYGLYTQGGGTTRYALNVLDQAGNVLITSRTAATLFGHAVLPASDGTYTLGNASNRWANVNANLLILSTVSTQGPIVVLQSPVGTTKGFIGLYNGIHADPSTAIQILSNSDIIYLSPGGSNNVIQTANNFEVQQAGAGIRMHSPNGNAWLLTISNAGATSVVSN